jgi:flavin reductase (DIM6/NTAB) family NADH-FMN oxidoreductase RutF
MAEIQFADEPIDPHRLRAGLGHYATGVAVMTTRTPEGKLEGLTANSFAAVSLHPPLILWSLRREAPSLKGFLAAKVFVVNVLADEQSHLSHHFASPKSDKFHETAFSAGLAGCPVLHDPLACFQCTTETAVDGGDHIIIIGRVRRLAFRDGKPLIFVRGQYCSSQLINAVNQRQ